MRKFCTDEHPPKMQCNQSIQIKRPKQHPIDKIYPLFLCKKNNHPSRPEPNWDLHTGWFGQVEVIRTCFHTLLFK